MTETHPPIVLVHWYDADDATTTGRVTKVHLGHGRSRGLADAETIRRVIAVRYLDGDTGRVRVIGDPTPEDPTLDLADLLYGNPWDAR